MIVGFIEPSYSQAFNWYKLRRAVYDCFVSEAKKGMKVLDVGCGAGTNIYIINDLFPDANDIDFHGIDISPKAIETANERKEKEQIKNCLFKVGDAENLAYDDDSFEIVICTEVLEHLLHPEDCLREIHRVLRRKGLAIITTPNTSHVLKRIAPKGIKDRIRGDIVKQEPCQVPADSYGHISELSSRQLISMCKEVGFRIEKIRKGSIVFGGPFYDRHQILFAILLVTDSILDRLPRNYDFSWGVVLKLRKPA